MTQKRPKRVTGPNIFHTFLFFQLVNMSGNGNNQGLPKWGALVADPNNQSLSNATRSECLSLLTQHDLAAQILDLSNIDMPNKRQFLDRARMIQTLSHAPEDQRKKVQSMLCMEYLSSKRVVPISVAWAHFYPDAHEIVNFH
jgi:hypothetical protein